MSSPDTFTCRDKQYRVTVTATGAPVTVGQTVECGDESMTVLAVTRGPEYNGTAKVYVKWVAHRNPAWIGGRYDYYDHALGLTVTPA